MKRLLLPASCLALIILSSGCASSSCNSIFSPGWLQNRPTPILDLFRGSPCNTCNPPAGQPVGFGTNFVPACENGCGGNVGIPQAPMMETPVIQGADPGIPYYPSDFSSAPTEIQTNGYLPSMPGHEVGSSLELNTPSIGNTSEVETPPMYGMRQLFN